MCLIKLKGKSQVARVKMMKGFSAVVSLKSCSFRPRPRSRDTPARLINECVI